MWTRGITRPLWVTGWLPRLLCASQRQRDAATRLGLFALRPYNHVSRPKTPVRPGDFLSLSPHATGISARPFRGRGKQEAPQKDATSMCLPSLK